MNTERKPLEGLIPALITPMDEQGSIDFPALEAQTGYLSAAGVNGFFVGGTTAEGAYLSTKELRLSFETVRSVSAGRQFLCLASLRPSTRMVIEEIEALADLEPDYLVIVAPYYLAAGQHNILQHFHDILAVSPWPVIVYNIPSTTHNPIELETVLALAGEEKVAGTKDSSGNFINFSRGVLRYRDPKFSWIQGEDYLHGPSLSIGARGIVSGLCNVHVAPYVEMIQAARERRWDRVNELQTRINRLYEVIRTCGGRTIPAIKAAVHLLGHCGPWMRQSSMTPTAEDLSRVRAVLEDLQLS